MQHNVTLVELSRLHAQIAGLEAELARYGLKYGFTDEARRCLDARTAGGHDSTRDS